MGMKIEIQYVVNFNFQISRLKLTEVKSELQGKLHVSNYVVFICIRRSPFLHGTVHPKQNH